MNRRYEPEDEDEEDDEVEDEEDENEYDSNEEDEEENRVGFERDLVFVIMPFTGEDMDEVYSAIRSECARIGLNAQTVREAVGARLVLVTIQELIEEAEFIICDLTRERPNVYYELGYAHGSQNPPERILLIAKEGTKVHFDIAPLQIQYYRSTEHLRLIVSSKLEEMRSVTRSWEE